eukprot:413749-Rhodomonas_salina.1
MTAVGYLSRGTLMALRSWTWVKRMDSAPTGRGYRPAASTTSMRTCRGSRPCPSTPCCVW